MEILTYSTLIIAMSLLIMYACNGLEQSLNYAGRNMKAGAKGALLLAVASSLPEIMVSLAFVFSGKPELILAGVFVTGGSAVVNILLIPAFSILYARDKDGNKVREFEIHRGVLTRDAFWLLATESLFIYFLGFTTITLMMSVILIGVYFLYVAHVLFDSKRAGEGVEEYEFESLDHTETHSSISWIGKLLDFNKILFKNKSMNGKTATVVGLLSVTVVGAACHYLAIGTEGLGMALGIPVIISATIFAAAATSLPDTILSINAAKNGDYEDAVGNAVGSNIFDTSFAVGIPLFIALLGGGMLIGQDLPLGIPVFHDSSFADTIRWFVLGTSAIAALALLAQAKKVTRKTAYFLLGMYVVWIGYLVINVM